MGRWQLLLALLTGGVLTIGMQGWYGVSAAGADPILDAADPNPAMSTPYQHAWQLFSALNKPAGNQSQDTIWEAWASDAETFPLEPDPIERQRRCAPSGA